MNLKIGNLFKGDRVIWMVLLFLCLISVVEVFSASSTLTYKSQNYLGPIIGHSWKILVGVGVFEGGAVLDAHHFPVSYHGAAGLIIDFSVIINV